MRHVIVIAEAGVNHNGSFELAQKMVDTAKKAGVDYVKFQTFNPKKLVSKYAEKAEYQKKTTGSDETQLQMLQKLTLTEDNFLSLRDYCRKVGIGFISTPFDLDSIDFLETFDMDFRENVLIKGIDEAKPEKIAREFDEVCLLFGIAGQTEESMRFDIETGLKYFERVCVNIMVENGTRIKPSPEVTDIFRNKIYADYIDNDRVDILMENTDFGVG